MTRSEVSRSFCVSETVLSSYESSGLIVCPLDGNGEPVYQERDVQLVGLVNTLLDSGMERETLRRYLSLRGAPADTGTEQIRLLRQHRAKLLDNLHGCQTALENIDYLIHEKSVFAQSCYKLLIHMVEISISERFGGMESQI